MVCQLKIEAGQPFYGSMDHPEHFHCAIDGPKGGS